MAEVSRPVATLHTAIELRNVSFRYSDEHPWILRNLNLTIPANRSVALVGLNGAGKTTLVKLLARLYDPCEGEILWDGVNIREFAPLDLRSRISAIFQDFARYDLTVFENISFGNVSHAQDSERVYKAARQAGAHTIIEDLPGGYHTVLSRWLASDGPGVDLSGGEWQRIAMARLFMREAEVLILDEPTAALDAKAEHELYSQFITLTAGRTCLLITHRFSTVRMANLIAVLDNGAISEYGTHEELLLQAGLYAELYNMQAEHYR